MTHQPLHSALRYLALPLLLLFVLAAPARADNMKTAKAVISKQLVLLKAGDVAKLKAGFTARLQDRITAENVKKGQAGVKAFTIDDLVAEVIPGDATLKIKMKNGRSLTTLVKTDGKWLADTIWFK